MNGPLVSFVVPCYKLAHYLGACLKSILTQTHQNLEVIVMDDHSPDDTASVVAACGDPRVTYVRNDPNLGHLRNYNKGIALAKGEYIWLISADDGIRSVDAVERYLRVMEAKRSIAFAFCPAMGMDGEGKETGIVEWTRPFTEDRTFTSREFLAKLTEGNCVSAPSGLVRRSSYEKAGSFPLDLPHAGDWYLWCAFAALGDVAYIHEPLIHYRMHGANMSTVLLGTKQQLVRDDQDKVRWRLKAMADKAGFTEVSELCVQHLAGRYAIDLAAITPAPAPEQTEQAIEAILDRHLPAAERPHTRAMMYSLVADQFFGNLQLTLAKHFYRLALRDRTHRLSHAAKLALVYAGGPGLVVRRALAGMRNALER